MMWCMFFTVIVTQEVRGVRTVLCLGVCSICDVCTVRVIKICSVLIEVLCYCVLP